MVTVLAIVGVVVVLFLAAALATRQDAALSPAVRDAADLDLPLDRAVRGEHLRGLRFGLAARGYRMSEVDAVLERLAVELDDRDRRLEELVAGVAPGAAADGVSAAPALVPPAASLPGAVRRDEDGPVA